MEELLSTMEKVVIDTYKKKYNKNIDPIAIDFVGGGMVRIFMQYDSNDDAVIKKVTKLLEVLIPVIKVEEESKLNIISKDYSWVKEPYMTSTMPILKIQHSWMENRH